MNEFAKFDHHEHLFMVMPFVKDSLSVGYETIDVPILQYMFPHLHPIKSIVYNYSEVEMILGQDVFHAIEPLEHFKEEIKILMSLSVCPLAGFSVARFPHQLVFEPALASSRLKT